MGWNPEGVTADQQMPADVPLSTPDRYEVGSEEGPEADAHDGQSRGCDGRDAAGSALKGIAVKSAHGVRSSQ